MGCGGRGVGWGGGWGRWRRSSKLGRSGGVPHPAGLPGPAFEYGAGLVDAVLWARLGVR